MFTMTMLCAIFVKIRREKMLEFNKAGLIKRGVAKIVDLILILALVIGIGTVANNLIGYDEMTNELENVYSEYSERYGINRDFTQEDYDKMTQEEKDDYNARVMEANKALNEDEYAQGLYKKILTCSLVVIASSFLVACFVLEFIIPLIFGNGQTIGKKIFGIGYINLFGNDINIFKTVFVSLIKTFGATAFIVPYCLIYFALVSYEISLVCAFGYGVLLLVNVICTIAGKNRRSLVNLLTGTVCANFR